MTEWSRATESPRPFARTDLPREDPVDRPSGRLRRAALPIVTVASGALALSSVPIARRLRKRMPEPLADLAVNIGIFGAVAAMLAVAERLAPLRPEWNEPDEDLPVDIGYMTLVLPPTALVARSLANTIESRLPDELDRNRWPRGQPLVLRVGLALLVSEFVHYWHHRLSHEVPSLWYAHAPHHSETRLYWMTATRLHPLDEVPLMVLQVASLAACGVDRDALLAHNTLKSFHGLLQHSNIGGSAGPLNAVFSTAEHHRHHHGKAPRGNTVNYGAVLNVWDRVFGTVRTPDGEAFAGDVGLSGMEGYPTGLVGQLLEPLRQLRRRR
jgi:sterol desaturase/sphingolipid hydroxylase (fatty acid hydroxylase superfamily)